MSQTTMLRDQHDDLLEVVTALGRLLGHRAGANAEEIRHLLSLLAGKVKVHLAMEDNSLYPRLVQSPDPRVRETATRFSREMGGIRDAFVTYLGHWPTPLRIQQDPQTFCRETEQLFEVLGRRIQSENTILYPLLDAQGK